MDNMSPEKHTGNAYEVLKNIKVAFTYIDEDMIKKPITTLICPKLECAATVWSLDKKETRKNTWGSNNASPKFK